MKILAIETSCDDTGVTILEAKGGIKNASFKILADTLAIQNHSQYGGVFPMMAKKEHIKNLPILLDLALKKAKLTKSKKPVDAIAVTYGPGLEPCLWTGITFAQELASKWGVPIIPVNHMEGHIFSVFGKSKGSFVINKLKFPIMSLLVSGGHTELVLTDKSLKHTIIGRTLDDAAGEAYDKVGRMLGLPYPGGPVIAKLADQERKALRFERLAEEPRFSGERSIAQADEPSIAIRQQANMRAGSARKPEFGQSFSFTFPRPMLKSKNLDFSFSGLKTAVLYFIKDNPKTPKQKVALEFENAVVETLVYKTQKAMKEHDTQTLIVGGGVSANKYLKKELRKITKGKLLLTPTKELSRDNAIMIGMTGYLRYTKNKNNPQKATELKAVGNLKFG